MTHRSPLAGRRVLLLTQGAWDHASSRVRGAAYLPAFRDAGADVTWLPRIPAGPPGVRRAVSKRVRAVARWASLWGRPWDLVVAQRQALPEALLRRLRQRGIPLVYDIDDAIYLPTSKADQSTARMVDAAARVIVSAPELATYCERLGVQAIQIPTPVDTDRFVPGPPPPMEPFVIGWVGSPSTTPYLAEVDVALRRLAAERPVRVMLVGADARAVDLPGVDVDFVPWTYADEPERMRQMHVGIMPLPDTPWTRGKAGYKLLLSMASGQPVVASPVGVNPDILGGERAGLLAQTHDEWYRALRRLADDAALRAALGRAGRERAVAVYSRTACTSQLLDTLADVLGP